MPKISIVVPIYKVEKYLHRCVDSILAQTFTDFECILVDDGSPDGCGEICDEYAKKDKRIKVIHKENGGLSDARNAGIDIAQGEYLGFVDSDDWIHPQMYEILYKGIIENKVKLSICAYQETDKQDAFEQISNPKFEIHNGMDFLVSDNVTAVVAWNKLYHSSLFEDIRYPVGRLHEDEFTTYKILYKAGNIAYCSSALYFYFFNENGVTKSKYSLKHLDAIEALEERNNFFDNRRLEQYRRWSVQQLMCVYNKHYILSGEEPSLKKEHKKLRRRLRIAILRERKRSDIDIERFEQCYAVAFPRLMNIYWHFEAFRKSLNSDGIMKCAKKSIIYIIKRNRG